ncbi:MAG: hypothetical protein SNJ29_07125 [Rikenellaceae bacterium]
MIHLEKDKLTITITGHCMVETYTTTVIQLIGLLRTQDVNMCNTPDHYYAVLDLIEAMMPDWQQAKAMIDVKADEEE